MTSYQSMSLRFFARRDIWIIPLLYITFGLYLTWQQHNLIYHPDQTPNNDCPTLADDILPSESNIRGYYRTNPDATTLVVLYHGNAGRACHRAPYLEYLSSQGHAIVLVEYPGFAEATKPRTEDMLKHTYEVAILIESLAYPQLVLIGESIGGGFASYHSTHQTPNGLILITPFARLSDRVQEVAWFYPARFLLHTNLLVAEWAQSAPSVAIILAEEDRVIPRRHSERVAQQLIPPPESTIIPSTNHNTLYSAPTFWNTIHQKIITAESVPR